MTWRDAILGEADDAGERILEHLEGVLAGNETVTLAAPLLLVEYESVTLASDVWAMVTSNRFIAGSKGRLKTRVVDIAVADLAECSTTDSRPAIIGATAWDSRLLAEAASFDIRDHFYQALQDSIGLQNAIDVAADSAAAHSSAATAPTPRQSGLTRAMRWATGVAAIDRTIDNLLLEIEERADQGLTQFTVSFGQSDIGARNRLDFTTPHVVNAIQDAGYAVINVERGDWSYTVNIVVGVPFAEATGRVGSAPAAQNDVLDQLRRLGELHRLGVLTDDEFASKKRELLDRL